MGSMGSIITPKDKFDKIMEKLSKSKCTTTSVKVYIYRDLEYNVLNYDPENCSENYVIHKKNVDTIVEDDFMICISKHETMDSDSFPKLNIYHDEYEKITKTYKFGTINFNLITITKPEKTINYIEITFQYKSNHSEMIIKDLTYVNNIVTI